MSITSNNLAVLAFSGGLDTSFCTVWLREQGYRVITATVNTGGWDAIGLAAIEARARELGAAEHYTLDARDELFHRYLRFLLFANARRGAGYPLCVSAERACQAEQVATLALRLGAGALAHGSTGAGNDQVRFDTFFSVIAPEIELVTPVRTLSLSRAETSEFLRKRGFAVAEQTERYSINHGLWGASIGGGATHNTWDELPATAWPEADLPKQPSLNLNLGFEQGLPHSLDGQRLEPVALVERLAAVGESYNIGRGIHLGDTILGIKGRVGYSAPAAHILIEAHRELEKAVLSAKQAFWKDTLGNLYGSLVHEAQYLDPLCRDLEALLASSQQYVSGTVRVRLEPGICTVAGCQSPFSLLALQPAAYGEQHQGWSGAEAAAFNRIYAQQQRLCWHQRQTGINAPEAML